MSGGPALRAAEPVAVPLAASLLPAVRELLRRRPLENLYFLSVLEHHRRRPEALAHRAAAVLRGDDVVAAVDCGRNLVLELEDEDDGAVLDQLARAARGLERGRHAVVGVRGPILGFVERYVRLGGALLEQRDQVLLACEAGNLSDGETRGVRRARGGEVDAVMRAHAAMCLDDLGHDQVAENPEGYRVYFQELVREGRVWVITEDGRIVFKAEAAIEAPEGAQVEGVYTAGPDRRQGLATRGMIRVCRDLLRRVPAVTLYVNEPNAAAFRLYDKLGFRRLREWHTAVLHAG